MENREAIEYIKWMRENFHSDKSHEACDMAISALEKRSRIITVTDADGGVLASVSNKDIIEADGVHVIISEE